MALRSAIRVGLSISEFEELTPYQLNLILFDYTEKEKVKQESKLFEIYLTAAWTSRWVWAKKVPKFEEIMSKAKSKANKKVMTDDQMLAQVKILNQVFGGTIIKNENENTV